MVEIWCSAVIILGVAAKILALEQEYNEQDQLGYRCFLPGSECSAHAVYRMQQSQSLQDVASIFGVTVREILDSSKLEDPFVVVNQPVLVPLSCSCSSANRSSAVLQHVVKPGETFYLIATNNFENLTTYQAIGAANPALNFSSLKVGVNLSVPVRCACAEEFENVTLVTYTLGKGETSASIVSNQLGVSEEDVVRANRLASPDAKLQVGTTVLIPVNNASMLNLRVPENNATEEVPKVVEAPKSSWGIYVGVGCAVLGLVLVVIAAIVLLAFRKKLSYPASSKLPPACGGYPFIPASRSSKSGSKQPLKNSSKGSGVALSTGLIANMSDLMESEKPLWYSFKELQEATDDFDPSCRIQGSVYAGVLRGTNVAIKRVENRGEAGRRFSGIQKELNILYRVHHANLVSLVGACYNEEQMFLVYEFAQNGSLFQWLHPSSACRKMASALSWKCRLGVALDVAAGLEYLHDYTKPSLVHKDLTSSNILLDTDFRAKIANFRTAMDSTSFGSLVHTKQIVGTQGYMAPEYFNGTLSSSMDVFAFGVVMLELLTGLEPVFKQQSGQRIRLSEAVLCGLLDSANDKEQQRKQVMECVDPAIREQCSEASALTFALLARSCLLENAEARPTMRNVSYALAKLVPVDTAKSF